MHTKYYTRLYSAGYETGLTHIKAAMTGGGGPMNGQDPSGLPVSLNNSHSSFDHITSNNGITTYPDLAPGMCFLL